MKNQVGGYRATVVLDRGAERLELHLWRCSFRVLLLPRRFHNGHHAPLLAGRVVVTAAPAPFVEHAAAHDYSVVVVTPTTLSDPEAAALAISAAFGTSKPTARWPFVMRWSGRGWGVSRLTVARSRRRR